MNEDTKRVLFTADGHPDEDQLLLALERELPVEDTARVEQHLGNCWSCRARFEEMQRGILAFVEYREKRYLPSLPQAPRDTSGFRGQLRSIAGEEASNGWVSRAWRKLASLFPLPRQVKWVSAVATVMAVVVLWVQVFINPAIVSANELLTRAAAAQNPPVTGPGSAPRRIVHQKVRISRGQQTVVKDFEWQLGRPPEEAPWKESDPMAWTAPLTAEGFANWRNSLREKSENVKKSGNLLTLDTTAGQDLVKEARIVVRADDFHPVEQHLRFLDDQQLDFTELAFQIVEEQRTVPGPARQTGASPEPLVTPPVPPGVAAAPPPVDLDEAELQLRYTLFTNHWDLGEDLSIGRTSSQVILSGTVSSRERGQAMQATLRVLPGVQLLIELPSISGGQSAKADSAIAPQNPAVTLAPLLKEVLENAFPSRQDRLEFVDRCLSSSDTALSHAWALRRLVDRYSEAEEQLLKPEAESKLREMLRTHLQELTRADSGLEPLLDLLPASRVATAAIPSSWRVRIIALFTSVQRQDRLLASLLVGPQTVPNSIAAASSDFRSAHESIHALLGALKDLAGDSMTR